MNIVIPASGAGSRFEKAGYTDAKPFIKVNGKFMILNIVENIGIPGAKYIFIFQKEHLAKYGAEFIEELNKTSLVKDFEIIGIDGITEGAACTVLLAEKFINNNDELLIANSDQLVEPLDTLNFVKHLEKQKADGGIMLFFNQGIKWSYAAINQDGLIYRVAEKQPISEHASVGIYWFNKGSDFVSATNHMIEKNDRTNGEFYLAPVFNHAILDEKKVRPYWVNTMHGLGTPEDLEIFLAR